MTEEKIQMFIMSKQKMFDGAQIPLITEKLKDIGDDKLMMITSANYKDPTVLLIVSLLLGTFGVDRFMLGETGLGVAKLLTVGGCGIWAIVDWFTVMSRTRQKNFEIFMEAVNMQSGVQTANAEAKSNNSIEQIKEYKQLLDAGIITAEEYETKKKELLK